MNKKVIAIEITVLLCVTIFAICHINIEQWIEYVKTLPLFYMVPAFVGLISLQIVFAFIPGEPLELAAGYLFGSWQGTIICLIGSLIGTLVVYCLVKVLKRHIIDIMFKNDKVEEVIQLFSTQKSMFWIFILFLIPGTPKDVMTYVASLGNIDLKRWLILTTVGRIPSIVTSTFLTGSLRNGEIVTVVIIFSITVVSVIAGILIYKKMIKSNQTIYIATKE